MTAWSTGQPCHSVVVLWYSGYRVVFHEIF